MKVLDRFGNDSPLCGFGCGEAVGFLFFQEGLQVVGKAKQGKVADWLKVDASMQKRRGLDHQLRCHSSPSKLLAPIVSRLITQGKSCRWCGVPDCETQRWSSENAGRSAATATASTGKNWMRI